jgi:uncharacterized integral membrane protein (TIGR00697 family)
LKTDFKRNYKYYDLIMAAFVAVLLCSNLIGVQKVTYVNLPFYGQFTFGAGVLFFPISYLFGDVLTEVYGYARSRKVIWAGFGALIFASLMSFVVTALPLPTTGAEEDLKRASEAQSAISMIFGQVPRIVFASLTAFWLGEFINSFVLAKIKLLMSGKLLFVRTIASTIFGEVADSLIFYPIAFYGIWSTEKLVSVMIANYLIKVLWEVIATPFTYLVVGFLKKAEHEDYYDKDTDFNPFSLET